MTDPTENVRRAMVTAINSDPNERESLEKLHGKVWSTKEVQEDFEITGFLAPFVDVIEKVTGRQGTLMFQHNPRYYFGFDDKLYLQSGQFSSTMKTSLAVGAIDSSPVAD